MRTFARDEKTNDITFGYYASEKSGNVILDANVIGGKTGVLSVVESLVKTERGELMLDTDAGIDHVGLMANGSNMLPFWRKDMEETVSNCEYVVSIKAFDIEMDRASQTVKYTLEVETTEGDSGTIGVVADLAKFSNYGNPPT